MIQVWNNVSVMSKMFIFGCTIALWSMWCLSLYLQQLLYVCITLAY